MVIFYVDLLKPQFIHIATMHEAIVLAGGLGTRLQSTIPGLPKVMAPISGKPFLEILLRSLSLKGFSRVILSLGYKAEIVINHFGESFSGLNLIYVVEQYPLGTGGALRLSMTHSTQDHVFIFNGDTFLDLEVTSVEDYWLERRNPIIIARQVPNTNRYGRLVEKNGLISRYSEKHVEGPGLINAGCYVFNRHQLDNFILYEPFSLENDFLTNAVKIMPVDLFITSGYFIDIGIPEDYQRAQIELS